MLYVSVAPFLFYALSSRSPTFARCVYCASRAQTSTSSSMVVVFFSIVVVWIPHFIRSFSAGANGKLSMNVVVIVVSSTACTLYGFWPEHCEWVSGCNVMVFVGWCVYILFYCASIRGLKCMRFSWAQAMYIYRDANSPEKFRTSIMNNTVRLTSTICRAIEHCTKTGDCFKLHNSLNGWTISIVNLMKVFHCCIFRQPAKWWLHI